MCLNACTVSIRQPPSKFARLRVDSRFTLKMTRVKINLTRLVRIAYNIVMVFIKPFNRTSMELKPSSRFRLSTLDTPLLIEPVWN